jgi:hypothetical protein
MKTPKFSIGFLEISLSAHSLSIEADVVLPNDLVDSLLKFNLWRIEFWLIPQRVNQFSEMYSIRSIGRHLPAVRSDLRIASPGCPTHSYASQDQGSSEKFYWRRNFLYSTYSPPIALDLCNLSIQLQKMPSKMACSIRPKMSPTTWRSECRSVNSHPNRSCLM